MTSPPIQHLTSFQELPTLFPLSALTVLLLSTSYTIPEYPAHLHILEQASDLIDCPSISFYSIQVPVSSLHTKPPNIPPIARIWTTHPLSVRYRNARLLYNLTRNVAWFPTLRAYTADDGGVNRMPEGPLDEWSVAKWMASLCDGVVKDRGHKYVENRTNINGNTHSDNRSERGYRLDMEQEDQVGEHQRDKNNMDGEIWNKYGSDWVGKMLHWVEQGGIGKHLVQGQCVVGLKAYIENEYDSLQTNQVAFVIVCETWCGFCQRLRDNIKRLEGKYLQGYVFGVWGRQLPERIETKVDAVPTVLEMSGNTISELHGGVSHLNTIVSSWTSTH